MTNDLFVKLGIALLLGFLIGIDRELKHKQIGMKTFMVISVASCLITIVSIESAQRFAILGRTNMDPLRLAAQIVSGVGFIGAGVILRRQNDVISGLTTAAMVWSASGLGIASGAGFYKEAVTAMVLIIVIVNLFPMIIKQFGPHKLREHELSIYIKLEPNDEIHALIDRISHELVRVKHVKVKDLGEDYQQLELAVSAHNRMSITAIYYNIKQMPHVHEVEVVDIRF
ncbi:MgtC/SapB family protein [Paenibacillus sp. GP183]|jgi:putative Mg2+ transporter-C (MgtC) family protein|uniref:MgtC/SapB family protein n=1 Tax=Paenibacillus sp. GP183 TaxID=1882751 RepID=UPI000899B5A2|nr:MgtC/SapB family protein [Paenibacillus sp. GP183]SEB62803.1 putative Mg2+ transporter-C (MgtC) family protein [Paenibacillus sp. GP183]